MQEADYLSVIGHALDHTFISTKPIWFDEKDEGNYFFLHIPIGTILTVDAVICTDFDIDARLSFPADDGTLDQFEFEVSIQYLATHCDLHGKKQKFSS